MDTCPICFSENKSHLPKILLQNKHLTKERGNKCKRCGTTSVKDGHGGGN
jgi:hypothetical protein